MGQPALDVYHRKSDELLRRETRKVLWFLSAFCPLNCTDNPLQYDFKTSPKNENLLIPVLDSANLLEKPCVKIVWKWKYKSKKYRLQKKKKKCN